MKDERARGEVCGKPSVLLCIPPRLQLYHNSYMENNPREEPVTVYAAPQPVLTAATKKCGKITVLLIHSQTDTPLSGHGDGRGNLSNSSKELPEQCGAMLTKMQQVLIYTKVLEYIKDFPLKRALLNLSVTC